MNYRKKPVVVEAWPVSQLVHDAAHNWSALPRAVIEHYEAGGLVFQSSGISVRTLEGLMQAEINDILIRGVKGEFYPCKPDIFDLSYEIEPADPLLGVTLEQLQDLSSALSEASPEAEGVSSYAAVTVTGPLLLDYQRMLNRVPMAEIAKFLKAHGKTEVAPA